MTLSDCMKAALDRVRLPQWNERAYLKLQKVAGTSFYGPWATLFDPITEERLGYGPTKLIPFGDEEDWEEHKGELVPDEVNGERMAKTPNEQNAIMKQRHMEEPRCEPSTKT